MTAILCGQSYLTRARASPRWSGLAPAIRPTRIRSSASCGCIAMPRRASDSKLVPAPILGPHSLYGKTPSSRRRAFRLPHSQTTVLAPTGTIGFMMDCRHHRHRARVGRGQAQKLVGGGAIKSSTTPCPGAHPAGLRAGTGREDRRPHPTRRAPSKARRLEAGSTWPCRLQLPLGQQQTLHPPHGPRAHDGRGPAFISGAISRPSHARGVDRRGRQ